MNKDRRRAVRKLRGQIATINRTIPIALSFAEWRKTAPEALKHRDRLIEDLNVLQTEMLIEKVESFGLSLIPENAPPFSYIGCWNTTDDGRRYLNDKYLGMVKRRIIDARFNYWKQWIDIVAPIASTIISIIALIVAIFALSK